MCNVCNVSNKHTMYEMYSNKHTMNKQLEEKKGGYGNI